MFAFPQERTRVLVALFALAVTVSPSAALAQMAPVGGDHYAARESDTGFAGEVSSNGGYRTSVPLDLPSARSRPIVLDAGCGVARRTSDLDASPKAIQSDNKQFDLSREAVGCFADNPSSRKIACGFYCGDKDSVTAGG